MNKEERESIDDGLLRLWVASMMISGKKVSTAKRYFGKIHSLFNEWLHCDNRDDSGITIESDSDQFDKVLPLFNDLRDSEIKEVENNLSLVKRLTVKNEKSQDWQTIRIFFFLLYNPSVSLSDIVNLTFDTAPRFCPQTDDIINSFDSSHGRKYLFELKQGKSRPHEIVRNLTTQLQSVLLSAGMQFSNGFSKASITSLWIAAALKSDIEIRSIRACIASVPSEYTALSIVSKNDIGNFTKEAIICCVADHINNYANRWFAMKLRQGVSIDDIKESIEEKLPGRLNSMTLFYPTRTEVFKEGRKRIEKETPYLPNVLFFKTQANKVKPLFANIGDLAWCFRSSNSPDSDYAVIPHSQMTLFQQCIGRFTQDIKMELVDARPILEKGRRVRVTGGIMAGYEGEILDMEEEPDKRVFFLSITENLQARWTAHVEDIYIQPIE